MLSVLKSFHSGWWKLKLFLALEEPQGWLLLLLLIGSFSDSSHFLTCCWIPKEARQPWRISELTLSWALLFSMVPCAATSSCRSLIFISEFYSGRPQFCWGSLTPAPLENSADFEKRVSWVTCRAHCAYLLSGSRSCKTCPPESEICCFLYRYNSPSPAPSPPLLFLLLPEAEGYIWSLLLYHDEMAQSRSQYLYN